MREKNHQARKQQSNVPVMLFFENFTQRDASALRHQQSHISSTVSHEKKVLPEALWSRGADARAAALAHCLGVHARGSAAIVSRSVMPSLCGEATGSAGLRWRSAINVFSQREKRQGNKRSKKNKRRQSSALGNQLPSFVPAGKNC